MKTKYLETNNDSRLEESDIASFMEKIAANSVTVEDVDCMYIGMSTNSQNEFLECLKAHITDPKEYKAVVMHFKSLSYLDVNRASTNHVRDYLGMQFYEEMRANA